MCFLVPAATGLQRCGPSLWPETGRLVNVWAGAWLLNDIAHEAAWHGQQTPGYSSLLVHARPKMQGMLSFEGSMCANCCTVCHRCGRAQGPTAHCPLQVELEGMREAHLRDAVALSDLLSFLEREVGRCCSAVGLPASTSLQSGRTD